jgi:hypothetical protein
MSSEMLAKNMRVSKVLPFVTLLKLYPPHAMTLSSSFESD